MFGVSHTSVLDANKLLDASIEVSIDRRRRATDNVFNERLSLSERSNALGLKPVCGFVVGDVENEKRWHDTVSMS